jgi:hypothetical protein
MNVNTKIGGALVRDRLVYTQMKIQDQDLYSWLAFAIL